MVPAPLQHGMPAHPPPVPLLLAVPPPPPPAAPAVAGPGGQPEAVAAITGGASPLLLGGGAAAGLGVGLLLSQLEGILRDSTSSMAGGEAGGEGIPTHAHKVEWWKVRSDADETAISDPLLNVWHD